ncbi:hypothetical protein FACS1894162_0820 [Bacteroidia bacterium]|nr:hypothetical protein FACS1894162_0820 [Bacteroidia bacterium]
MSEEKKNPFLVPEGYFEGLTNQIMSQLPERVSESPKVISLWERVKPWMYMAAMFAGIYLMVNLFTQVKQTTLVAQNTLTETEMEEYYQYYEDQAMQNSYHEAVFLEID